MREGDGEVVDVGLGRAVDAEEGSGNAARERRQVDDRALAAVDRRKKKVRHSVPCSSARGYPGSDAWLSGVLLDHQRQHNAGKLVHGLDVHLDERLLGLLREVQVLGRPVVAQANVVHYFLHHGPR